jgi:hypothetical protein
MSLENSASEDRDKKAMGSKNIKNEERLATSPMMSRVLSLGRCIPKN